MTARTAKRIAQPATKNGATGSKRAKNHNRVRRVPQGVGGGRGVPGHPGAAVRAAARGGAPRVQPRVRGQRADGARRGAGATSAGPSGDIATLLRECLNWALAPLGEAFVRVGEPGLTRRRIEALRTALRLIDAASAPRRAPGRSAKRTATRKTNRCATRAARAATRHPCGPVRPVALDRAVAGAAPAALSAPIAPTAPDVADVPDGVASTTPLEDPRAGQPDEGDSGRVAEATAAVDSPCPSGEEEAPCGSDAEEPREVGPSVADALEQEDPHLHDPSLFAAALAGLPPEARADRADVARLAEVYESAPDAGNTLRVYRNRLRLFAAWCARFGLAVLPAHPEVVRLHLIELAQEKLSLSTMDVTLAAIAWAHRLVGRDPPASERLTLALRGLRQRLAKVPEAIPLTLMRQIVAGIGDGAFAVRDRALLLTAYFGGLRRCQAVALFVEHAHRRPDGYFLRLVEPKKLVQPPAPLPFHPDPALCPVLALDAWIAMRATWTAAHPAWSAGRGPLFVALHRQGERVGQILTPLDVDRILTLRARAAGISAPLSAHGLRAGVCETRR